MLAALIALAAASAVETRPGVDPYVAFSLRAADERAARGWIDDELCFVGGVTRILGMVYDAENDDVVLVGRAIAGAPAIRLDQIVVALRARMVHGSWPGISLDATHDPRVLRVRADGGIETSIVYDQFLAADVLLKTASLHSAALSEQVPTYRETALRLRIEAIEQAGSRVAQARWVEGAQVAATLDSLRGCAVTSESMTQARFWFAPRRPQRVLARDGVFAIDELALCVHVEWLGTDARPDPSSAEALFASYMNARLADLMDHEALRDLKPMADAVQVAEGIRALPRRPELSYLLHCYELARPVGAATWPAEELCALMERTDGALEVLQITGGVELSAELTWLNDGDVSRLRGIVLSSRPSAGELAWRPPLEGWDIPNTWGLHADAARVRAERPGFSISTTCLQLLPDRTAPNGAQFPGWTPPRPLNGVSMRMQIDLTESVGGAWRDAADAALRQRPLSSSLWWRAAPGVTR